MHRVTVLAALALTVALSAPAPGRAVLPASDPDTVIIAYDDGVHTTWWCSDKDSFGAAVRFTPAQYPCEVVGARAEVGYDESPLVFLRVYDDSTGLPGKVLYEQQRSDIPHGGNVGFRDYDLTSPITIPSGDFYICFWQKHWFALLFGTDSHMDSLSRQWWYLPPGGWVPPSGTAAADHLIRAKVIYPTGIADELLPEAAGAALRVAPDPAPGGRATVRCNLPAGQRAEVTVYDASGRALRHSTIAAGQEPFALDLRGVRPGVYLVRVSSDAGTAAGTVVVGR